jgi:hypothetical protein
VHGIHAALRVLGAMTILSTLIFRELTDADGDAVSSHRAEQSIPS